MPQADKDAVQKLASVPIFELRVCSRKHRGAFIPRPSLDAILFRQGWRADKAITSFHKNRIFVKTRKVMGNTDVAHYRGQLAKAVSAFFE